MDDIRVLFYTSTHGICLEGHSAFGIADTPGCSNMMSSEVHLVMRGHKGGHLIGMTPNSLRAVRTVGAYVVHKLAGASPESGRGEASYLSVYNCTWFSSGMHLRRYSNGRDVLTMSMQYAYFERGVGNYWRWVRKTRASLGTECIIAASSAHVFHDQ